MMIQVTLEKLSNAIKNARKHRCKVRHQEDEIFLVKCDNPDHTTPHAVYFEERKGELYAACDCPSRVACYHIAIAWSQREHVQEVRFQAEIAKLPASGKSGGILQYGSNKPAERIGHHRI
jgi:hypothetical protein